MSPDDVRQLLDRVACLAPRPAEPQAPRLAKFDAFLTACVHEAAHAVLAELAGLRHIEATVELDGQGLTTHKNTRADPLLDASVSIAGILGEQVYLDHDPIDDETDSGDTTHALAAALRFSCGDADTANRVLDAVESIVETVLCDPRVAAAVDQIALRLVIDRTATARQIRSRVDSTGARDCVRTLLDGLEQIRIERARADGR